MIMRNVLILELVCVAAACVCIIAISLQHQFEKKSELVTAEVLEFTSEQAVYILADAADEAMIVPVDDVVWTSEEAEYSEEPGGKAAGTLDKYAQLTRSAMLRTGWSRVVIDEEEYYVSNDSIIEELPFTVASGYKGELQLYALSQFENFGWADTELQPLINLWNKESGWNPNSHNRHSGAHGIPQALPASKMASEGSDYYTNGRTQIRWGLKYIKGRYGSPSRAWAHFRSKGWY